MSRPDNEPVPEIPELMPEHDELRHKPIKQKPPLASEAEIQHSGSRGNVWAYVAGVVALAAVGWAGYLQSQLFAAEVRVTALEQRLSSTDESVNQSSGALQVKINEVDAALTEVRDETLKKYKTALDQRGAQIDALDKTLKSTQGTLAKLDQRNGEQDKALETTRVQLDKLPPLIDASKKKLDEHQVALDAVPGKIKAVSDAQVKLDARLANNEEWVESINTFRKQMNREIVNIKQQIAGGKPAPVPAEPLQ